MKQSVQIRVPPEERDNTEVHMRALAAKLSLSEARIAQATLRRRSLDARGRNIVFELLFDVWLDEVPVPEVPWVPQYKNVERAAEVHIIGAGPAGLFAGLRFLEHGLRPVIIERGKAVRPRRRDVALLAKRGVLDEDSNYCFGEGGAGTFSDGKLYTRSKKRGDLQYVLETFVHHGAKPEILIDTHPHIGTNRLPAVVTAIRETIESHGGLVCFEERVNGFEVSGNSVTALRTTKHGRIPTSAVLLATGHSARDIFVALQEAGITIEAKPFALGVRVEHQQQQIDSIQYSTAKRLAQLPAASYALRAQVENVGVFSFCMCPGGIICPAATAAGEVVVNGWSPSKRNNAFANSGIVVEVSSNDLRRLGSDAVNAGIHFQRTIEQRAFDVGGGACKAPAQRLSDFVAGQASTSLPPCSYLPGVTASKMEDVFHGTEITKRLREAFKTFNRQMKGFVTEEAIVVATESRTSSPIRIPRDPMTMMHTEVSGLFPCGEGAGYAGGIMSAALDGIRVADAILEMHKAKK